MDDSSTTATIIKAMRFAALKHRNQRRKDPDGTPYINHPLDLVHILWFEGQVREEDVLIAAILHDTVEDTDTTLDEIEDEFGPRVSGIVNEVTDDKGLNRRQRKNKQIENAPNLSPEARLVKLADKISNLRDIYRSAPKGWSEQRQAEYFTWAGEVIHYIRGANSLLEQQFDQIYQSFFERHKPAIYVAHERKGTPTHEGNIRHHD